MPTLNTALGLMEVPSWEDDIIIRSLRDYGEWGAIEVKLLASLVSVGDCLWDIGAFLGTFSLGVARHVALKNVLAVEANPTLREALNTNLQRNLPCSFEVLSEGVGRKNGWIAPTSNMDELNHGARSYGACEGAIDGAIRCQSLHNLRMSYGNYDVLKVDVEGMELEILSGDSQYIKNRKPVIWAECNEDPKSLHLFAAMCWFGYEPLYLAFPAFSSSNFNGKCNPPLAYEAVLLAAPPDRIRELNSNIEGEDIILRRLSSTFDLRRALYDTPRWSSSEWAGLSRAELIARMGRHQSGVSLQNFLTSKDIASDQPT